MAVLRYVVLLYQPEVAAQEQTVRRLSQALQGMVRGWNCDLECPGLRVFHIGGRELWCNCYVFPSARGVIVGTLFIRGASGSAERLIGRLGSSEEALIVSTNGRWLLESHWGRYVAIFYDDRTGVWRVLRDPSGTMPCLMTTFQGITVLFSTLQDAVGLGVVKPSVDWRYISAHVIYPQLNGAETALNEVSEICAGECFSRIGARTSRSFFWHPAKFAGAQSESEEPGEWIDAVYSTTKGCVHSWASGHQSIVHRLSGGLDSCVVLACLGDVPHRPRLAALNCYTDAAAGDERTYARDAAARSRCRFVEQRIGDGVDMRRILELRPAARPGYYLTSLQAAGTESALAREVSATALFGGGWGDQLFFRSRNDYAAMDYLNRHGVSGRWLSVVRDVAQLSRSTVWRVLGRTLANTLRHSTWNPLPGEPPQNTLVEGGIYREFHKPECVLHPWFRDASHLPWGKLWHILLLAAPADFQRPLPDDDDPESIEPLRSQPLIELCLRIPTYVMTWGAGDRLIERMAFRRELPERVLQRLSKGFVDEGLQIMVRQNAGFVRELLLDGLLVRERILDRRKLERMLGEDALRNGRVSAELFAHISTEAWLSRVTS